MQYYTYLFLVFLIMNTQVIIDFNNNSNLSNWNVVDDTVMGGRSAGNFQLTSEGHGKFSGNVSLENNGGFSSVRHNFKRLDVSPYSKIILKVKGDGKNYQFRIKDDRNAYYSYISEFTTNGEWQEIEISMQSMYPSYRGRKLDLPNYVGNYVEEITFLIANKKPQGFQLLIDKIELK
jgi:NADH dehydrogenase [ubiquinone] 1 alpha subcomplex assembly factor 1